MFELLNIELSQISGGCVSEENSFRYTQQTICLYDKAGKLFESSSNCGCPKTEPKTYNSGFCQLLKTDGSNQYICNYIKPRDLHKVLK
jgi:hypothetical protein